MKNTVILIAITIALVLALTACGKIEDGHIPKQWGNGNTTEKNVYYYNGFIKKRALEELGFDLYTYDLKSELLSLNHEWERTITSSIETHNVEYLLVIYAEEKTFGYIVNAHLVWKNGTIDEITIFIAKEVNVSIGHMKDLKQGGESDV